tara:strand:- start:15 stop:191 length:177 start_codon:yes stop_codon:yes gene_type:complete
MEADSLEEFKMLKMMRRIRRYVRRHGVETTRQIIAACSQPERSELEKALRAYRREMAC